MNVYTLIIHTYIVCSQSCSGCPCNFCGWCLSDCGDSAAAHKHVAHCSLKPLDHKPLDANEDYHGTLEEFHAGV